jgi:arsenate reductase-like glutaredoxin family protein
MEEISVYWTPGCSSCVKVKEFLTQNGVPFESGRASDPGRPLGIDAVAQA